MQMGVILSKDILIPALFDILSHAIVLRDFAWLIMLISAAFNSMNISLFLILVQHEGLKCLYKL